jgi:DNA-binding SARP family transcriptional activator
VEFRILGPVEATAGGAVLPLGGSQQRALLALLLLHANEVVPRDRLIDALWPDATREAALRSLHVAVSSLRKALGDAGAGVIVTRAPGYVAVVEAGQLDAARFERLERAGRDALAAGDPESAARLLGEALGLWRGSALADLADEEFARGEALRLDDARLSALEDLAAADVERGRHAEALSRLEALVIEQPLRERPRALQMLALYRAGRQAEALEVYRRTRALLVESSASSRAPSSSGSRERFSRNRPTSRRRPAHGACGSRCPCRRHRRSGVAGSSTAFSGSCAATTFGCSP